MMLRKRILRKVLQKAVDVVPLPQPRFPRKRLLQSPRNLVEKSREIHQVEEL
jgi:hypothetical protein